MPAPALPSILTHFSTLEDPRQKAKVLYPLVEILLLALAPLIHHIAGIRWRTWYKRLESHKV